jgi:PiT family inorganic phosphate transporter
MCIVGLGWGRASRTTRLSDAATAAMRGEPEAEDEEESVATDGRGDDEGPTVPKIGDEDPDDVSARDLFDPSTTGRVIALWILTPTISAVASYLVFRFLL